jgi:hypothetical protein
MRGRRRSTVAIRVAQRKSSPIVASPAGLQPAKWETQDLLRFPHLRKHENIAKRRLVHIAGLNLALLMQTRFGVGKPRCLQGRAAALRAALIALLRAMLALWRRARPALPSRSVTPPLPIAHVSA